MRKTVVIISGRGGSGKDLICNIIAKHYRTVVHSTVDDVKRAAGIIGWNGEKTTKNRLFLYELKSLCKRYYDYPYRQAVWKYNCFSLGTDEVLFIHCREPEEIERLWGYIMRDGMAQVYTLLVTSSFLDTAAGNLAEDGCGRYPYDFVFNNDSPIEQLEGKVMEFWERRIIGGQQPKKEGE